MMMNGITHGSFLSTVIGILICVVPTVGSGQELEVTGGDDQDTRQYIGMAARLADSASVLLYEKWDLPAAKKMLDRALQLDPNNGRARADLAWYHVLFGHASQALREIKNAVQAEPKNPLWHAWLGWIHLWNEELEAAEMAVDACLRINPSFAEGLHVKSKILLAQGDFNSAIATHAKAASLDGTWSYALAQTHALAGNADQAREILNNLEHNQWNSYGRVKVYLALGERTKALEWLKKSYEQRHPYLIWCRQDKDLQEIWNTSEFQEIYAKLGL